MISPVARPVEQESRDNKPLLVESKYVYIHTADAHGCVGEEQERPRLSSSIIKAITGIFCCA